MLQCWEFEPKMRPTFSSIVDTLSHFLEGMVEYMDISAFAYRSEPNATAICGDSRSDAMTVFKNDNFIEIEMKEQ